MLCIRRLHLDFAAEVGWEKVGECKAGRERGLEGSTICVGSAQLRCSTSGTDAIGQVDSQAEATYCSAAAGAVRRQRSGCDEEIWADVEKGLDVGMEGDRPKVMGAKE